MITSQNHRESEHQDKIKQLNIFLGKWRIEGKNLPVPPNNVENEVSGEDNYAWLEGQFFIIDNWQHLAKGSDHIGITILGYDIESQEFFTRNFDNLGFERRYVLQQQDNLWNFIGSNERATRRFDNQGKTYEEHWEIFVDNKWIPLCIMRGTKI